MNKSYIHDPVNARTAESDDNTYIYGLHDLDADACSHKIDRKRRFKPLVRAPLFPVPRCTCLRFEGGGNKTITRIVFPRRFHKKDRGSQ